MGTPALSGAPPAAAGGGGGGEVGLRFDRPGGPVVAVCGLAGGAGTTTLAWHLARQAHRESPAGVLLTETEALAGGVAVLAGRASTLGLTELAELLDTGAEPAGPPFVALGDGPRLLATLPTPNRPAGEQATRRVLSDAKAAHGLLVLDCRTTGHPAAATLLAAATHIIWVLPATPVAVVHAELLLASGALPAPRGAREAMVAIATRPGRTPTIRALRQLAERRAERLILIGHLPDLPDPGRPAGGALAAALGQIATFLRP